VAEVRELRQPMTFAGLSPRVEGEIERAFWAMLAKRDRTQTLLTMSERDAFKWAVRELFLRLRAGDTSTTRSP
jgi:hypothetical protein